MANVLAELFGDIAAAIREKTGDEGTMKPIEFPDEIRAIVTGGGDSGESGGESGGSGSTDVREVWLFDNGEFKPEEYQVEINHSLGKVPDIVFLKINASEPIKGSVRFLTNAFSMSESLLGGSTNIGSVPRQYYGFYVIYDASSHYYLSITGNSIEKQASADTSQTLYFTDKILRFGDPNLGRLQKAYTYYWGAYAKRKLEGDSGDLMRYVTFIGANGQEIHKESVIVGDDCPNPVPSRISTPIKASTVSHTYTFNGWSLTDGGYASSEALKNVTTDRTVYAEFKESVRAYTVSFYDGNLLVKTEKVVYGGSSAYVYRKQGYIFNGWNPEPTNITGDISCYAQLTEAPAFAKLSWAEIAEISESGKASEAFNIGDEKTIILTWSDGTTEYVDLQIASFNNNYNRDTAKPMITLITKNLLSKTSKYFSDSQRYRVSWDYDDDKYEDAVLRKFLTKTVYSGLPEDLRAVMKVEDYYYPDPYSNPDNMMLDDWEYIRPPASNEVKQHVNGKPAFPIFTDTASKIKLKNGSAFKWALAYNCSDRSLGDYDACYIDQYGVHEHSTPTAEFGVCFLVFI